MHRLRVLGTYFTVRTQYCSLFFYTNRDGKRQRVINFNKKNKLSLEYINNLYLEYNKTMGEIEGIEAKTKIEKSLTDDDSSYYYIK